MIRVMETETSTFLDGRDGVAREDKLPQPGDVDAAAVTGCEGEGGGDGGEGVRGEVEAVEVGEAAEGAGRDGAQAAAGEVQLLQVVQVPRGEGVVVQAGQLVAREDQHLGQGCQICLHSDCPILTAEG